MVDMQPPGKIEYIATSNLHFDPENPRFYRLNDAHSVDAVIEEMLDDEGVQDLMLSIGQKGYFEGEPLLIAPDEDGRLVVVEGNRRLAAVKLLNGEIQPPVRRKNTVGDIRAEAREVPTKLPCLWYQHRRDVLRYLGYRHITGVKEWDSLSKAKYLQKLRDEFYPNETFSDLKRILAKDIGSRPDYVAQLLTALALYVKARDEKYFGLQLREQDISFSLITTTLYYKKFTDWLGLIGREDVEMLGLQQDRLKKIFAWIFVPDQQGRTILGESRNLELLADIVTSDDAIIVLEETGKLSEAYLYTDGPQSALQSAIDQAAERVRVIWNMLPKTKPFTQNHVDQAETLFESVRDVRNYLRAKFEE
jgi:hypothetical protein